MTAFERAQGRGDAASDPRPGDPDNRQTGPDSLYPADPGDRFYTEPAPGAWAVGDHDGDEVMHHYADEEQARYVAMLRNAGVQDAEADWMAERANCSRCGSLEFRGAFDTSGRCSACQS